MIYTFFLNSPSSGISIWHLCLVYHGILQRNYPSVKPYVLRAHKNRHRDVYCNQMVLLSTHNICFGWEIGFNYTLLSGGLLTAFDDHKCDKFQNIMCWPINFYLKTNFTNWILAVSLARKYIWASTCEFQQCGILTNVDSNESVQPPFKLRNSKCCSVTSLTSLRISKRLVKALISLHVCAGWSEALLVAHTTLLEISCPGSFIKALDTSYKN